MAKILAVLLWPAGIALIIGAGALLARRARPAMPATSGTRPAGTSPVAGRHGTAATIGSRDLRLAAMNSARLIAIVVVGAAAVYGLMAALGTLVVHAGPSIDKPILHWVMAHRVSSWAHVMDRLTKLGDTWTTWGAGIAGAACLAVTWRRDKWLPPVTLATAIVVDHYLTLAIRHTFHRIGPPGSPGGTFPSGGVDRCVLLYGLVAYLLWREFSGQRRMAIWAAAAVAALAFNEAYSREYLTLHWFTDVLSGLVYGCLLLALVITAVRLVAGPADRQARGPAGAATAPAAAPSVAAPSVAAPSVAAPSVAAPSVAAT
jgi:membrane-associated phospholipid phosphatase